MTDRLPLPTPPAAPAPWRFPVVASLAPVVVSVAIWLVTGSVFALLFAALGPVTALASAVDQRWGRKRATARELARFRAETDALAERIRNAHREEGHGRDDRVPDGPAIVSAQPPDRGRWAYDGGPLEITVGRGRVESELSLDPVPRDLDDASADRLIELVERARSFNGAVTVDARLGIGVCGPRRAAISVLRGLVIQCARALSPAAYWVGVSRAGAEGEWLADLPHPSRALDQPGFVVEFGRIADGAVVARIAAAATDAELPGSCRAVVAVASDGPGRIVAHPDRRERRDIAPAYVSALDAASWASEARRDAQLSGAIADHDALPALVALSTILRDPVEGIGPSLECEIGVGRRGPVSIDLVGQGPHAIVGGTTGSGKSEFLVSWVLAMAAAYSPDRFTVLLVDFKGGSAFGPLESLPHTVGIITDLDPDQAERALVSLKAELRHRERELVVSGAKSVDGTTLPRLVIIVDEFAAMLAEHPDLHALFSDIAARGRSLGLHLILCTQRPAASVRDGVLANADLRVSLRVNNPADSAAVIGTAEAAELAIEARGRAIMRVGGGDTEPVQVAIATGDDTRLVRERWRDAPAPRRPWCDPLPNRVRPSDLEPVTALAIGLLDLPDEQRRATASYDPGADGALLVLGAPRSGKSNALAALGVPVLPDDPCTAWDALARVTRDLDSRSILPGHLVIDDLDALVPRFGPEHRVAWLDMLARILREGPGAGLVVAASAHRMTGDLGALSGLFPSRLMLRHASTQDWVLAGGDSAVALVSGAPGAGRWKGQRIQVVLGEPVASRAAIEWDILPPDRPLAIATTRAASVAAGLTAGGVTVLGLEAVHSGAALGPGAAVVADVDEWQSRWGALAALRPSTEILLEGCSPAELRALTRSRELPPPLPSLAGSCWRLRADGSLGRARLPTAPVGRSSLGQRPLEVDVLEAVSGADLRVHDAARVRVQPEGERGVGAQGLPPA